MIFKIKLYQSILNYIVIVPLYFELGLLLLSIKSKF